MTPSHTLTAAQPHQVVDLDAIRAELEADLTRLSDQLGSTKGELSNLRNGRFRDGGDEAEVGAVTLEAD